jgi:glycosyltransferase involved in cell wall biosynthesis
MISIIIPTYKRENVFLKCLNSLKEALHDIRIEYEVIIVNDDKENDLIIDVNIKNLKIVNNNKSGVSSARNLGASLSQGNILIFIDNDMIVNQNAIIFASSFIETHMFSVLNFNWEYPIELEKKLDSYSFGRFLKKINYNNLKGWMEEGEWKKNSLYKMSGIASCFLAIKREDFINLGGYNENIPFSGFEDYVFKEELLKNKFSFWLNSNITLYHNEEDKLELKNWLKSKYLSAKTKRIAYENGYSELRINKNIKVKIFILMSNFDTLILKLLDLIPNNGIFDSLYFFIVKILIGINNYKGYFLK